MQNGSHEAIRQSWGKNLDVRFFIGQEPTGSFVQWQDEITLGVDDSYQGLAQKVKKILAWSLDHGYDFTFLADNDTFVMSDRLLKSGFEKYDYSGRTAPNRELNNKYSFCHGGYGYFVSRKLAELIVKTEPKTTDEDRFVGQVASDNGIIPQSLVLNTFHFPTSPYGRRYHPETRWQELMYYKYCLGREVQVHSENPSFNEIKVRAGQILVRMKSGKTMAVSASTSKRMIFRGAAVYV